MKRRFAELSAAAADLPKIKKEMAAEAQAVHREKRAIDEAIGRFGAEFMPAEGQVMTQCNAGALATGGIGTALGVFQVAHEQGKRIHVFVPETRPYLQGARLTAWELHRSGIPLTLITDNMVGHFLKTGNVRAIVTGADRIAANGDSANKIGTYQIAVLAKENNVPFYIAAPISTLDLSIPGGDHIPIEERSSAEVTQIQGVRIAPDVPAAHPAFDVTPNRYIAAIFTERGVARVRIRNLYARFSLLFPPPFRFVEFLRRLRPIRRFGGVPEWELGLHTPLFFVCAANTGVISPLFL